ncbi:MAG: response regulator [Anaerolineae bacterium]|nr:response regulator [Anaerolineae bacterium]
MKPLQGKRIFYVEDDVRNRFIVKTILERAGAILDFHYWGGGDLIVRMEAFAPLDMILLDLSLPGGLSGYDVYASIRSRVQFAGVPVVAVSARDASIEIPQAVARGFDGYISKPIDMARFPEQIATALSGVSIWE